MALNIRFEGPIAILSNFARLMNDPRYVDAARDVQELLDQGYQNYVLELAGVKETGSSFLGVLMTITREIRQRGGEAVLARPGKDVERYLTMMQMDEYWDIFGSVEEAENFFVRDQGVASRI